MTTSKHLITALEKSDWLDRLLILAALVFFVLVVLFILQQRLVNRTLRVAFFWTRFIPSSKGKTVDVVQTGVILASSTTSAIVTSFTASLASTLASSTAQSPGFGDTPLPTSVLIDSLPPSDAPISTTGDQLVFDPEQSTSTSQTENPSEVPRPHDEL